jgi:hypothetical protein
MEVAMTVDPTDDEPVQASNWTGWVAFGAVMLILTGAVHVIQGWISLLDESYYLTTPEGLALNISYTALGWLQLGLGALGILIGVGMLRGNVIALVSGVIVAAVSAIAQVTMIAAYPVWSLTVIMFDVLVIFSIMTHGREMKELRGQG